MPKSKTPKTYEQQRDEWYSKLAAEGFNDLETKKGNLKSYSYKVGHRGSYEQMQAKQAYYLWAEHFLNDYPFESELEKTIWEYHTNGISYRDISTTLQKAGIDIGGKNVIHRIVSKLEKVMKDKYLPSYRENN